MKRVLDVSCALAGLVLLSPLLAVIAAIIWIEDRNSPLYAGWRVGRGGGRFRMIKFRTMIPDAWKSGVSSTAADDRRITRAGKWLRRSKLDELPQLWNVLTGEMSLVGPRPQVETDASMYTPEERGMLEARPGLTDLASIVFSDEAAILAGSPDPDVRYNQLIRPWKSRLALLYLRNQRSVVDLRILALTLTAAISRQRALQGVARLLVSWGAEEMLVRMAQRQEPLVAWPPPGASDIVSAYPRCTARAAN